jgi:predicted kinase
MATHDQQVKITCPCCQSTLVLDRESMRVLYHLEHHDKPDTASFDTALKELKEKEKQMSSRFQQAVTEEKQRKALLAKKFQELQKHAAENPDAERPARPFDFE